MGLSHELYIGGIKRLTLIFAHFIGDFGLQGGMLCKGCGFWGKKGLFLA